MPRGFELDWVLVRVNTLKRIVAVAVTGILAALLVVIAYVRLHVPPEQRARRAIERAEVAHERVRDEALPAQWQGEVEQAAQQLDGARVAFSDAQWDTAEVQANEARSRFEALLGAGQRDFVGVGRFFSLEGRIQVQRAGRAEWQNAHLKMPVFNGDFVKSARDGSAEIIFNDGTLYRIAPNSLLEIHHVEDRERGGGRGTVTMVVGRINVYTSSSPSTVTTDSTETEIERDSRVAVDVNESQAETTVATFVGSAKVRNPTGEEVTVASREAVAASREGRFSPKRRIPEVPVPAEPPNSASFDLSRDHIIQLRWRRPGGTRVHLQVSRSQRFTSELDVDAAALDRDSARLQAIQPGTYFWRLAAVGDGAVRSEWSQPRRFRILAPGQRSVMQDHEPPELVVEKPQQLGQMFIVEGHSEPGAVVTINDEPVELDAEGRFRKTIEATHEGWNELLVVAVDPSGNRSERRERAFVEVY